MVLREWCAIAGAAVLIAGGCGADGSTASTPEGTTPGTSLATTAVVSATSTAPSNLATTTMAVVTVPSIASPSTIVTVPLGYSAGPDAVAEALEAATVLWSDANISRYRLTIADGRNFWSAGCKWNIAVTDGVVTDNEVDPSSTSTSCIPLEWTVEELHEMVAHWLGSISEFAAPNFGEHTIQVQFNDIGVPVAMEYDLANGADEESSMHVAFTADA